MNLLVRKRVYQAVRAIPKGRVATYGDIARVAMTSARAIGSILHINPDPKTIPCHRVVFADGRLSQGFAFGGIVEQKSRLESEGVFVNEHDHVSLRDYRIKS